MVAMMQEVGKMLEEARILSLRGAGQSNCCADVESSHIYDFDGRYWRNQCDSHVQSLSGAGSSTASVNTMSRDDACRFTSTRQYSASI